MLPTYSLQVGQTCILTVIVANLQPTSLHNHVSSPCRLPTYSLQVQPTIPPHHLANLLPRSLHNHGSSPCMLPTYSLQVRPNMHPHRGGCQPTAYKFAQPWLLPLYVANLQPASWPNMHPLRVCCQPTAYKFAQTCILTVCVANLQPTSLHNHVSSPCVLPTYSLQVCTTMSPHPVGCQLTAYKFNLPSLLTLLPTYSLEVCTTMAPPPVCCQPTAYKFVQTCILTVEVAILQPQLLAIVSTCNALQWPDFSCSLKRRLATCPNSIAARLYRRALRSATEHGIPWDSCVGLPPNAATTGAQEAHAKRTLQTNWVVPGPFRNGLLSFHSVNGFVCLTPRWCVLVCSRQTETETDGDRQTWHIIFQCFILEVIPLASVFSSSSQI